jgi:hypothetical protein
MPTGAGAKSGQAELRDGATQNQIKAISQPNHAQPNHAQPNHAQPNHAQPNQMSVTAGHREG